MTTYGLTLEEAQLKLDHLQYGDQTRRWYASAHGHGGALATGEVDLFVPILEQARELRDFIRRQKALKVARERQLA